MKLRKSGSGAFLLGAASILDIGAVGPLVDCPRRPRARSVNEALAGDMKRVGRDFARAIDRVREPSQP